MAISLVASTSAALGTHGGASSAIDTTGANLLVISAAWWAATTPTPTVSDSKGNTWLPLTARAISSSRQQLYYALAPIVGSGHTFTVSGTSTFASFHVHAFSGVNSYQTESGATKSTTSPLASGSVTPSFNGALVLTGLGATNVGTDSVTPAGFTLATLIPYVASTQMNCSAAYVVQTTAAAINPTWAWTGTHSSICVSTAVFLAEAPADPRISQAPIELLSQPLLPASRVSASIVEILGASVAFPAPGAISQYLVELLSENLSPIDARVSQLVTELLSENIITPAQVTQALVEILSHEDFPVRITLLGVELLITGSPAASRTSQLAVELFYPRPVILRTSQLAVEVFYPKIAATRSTQQLVEYYQARAAATRASSAVVEIFLTLPPCVAGDFPIDIVTPGGSCSAGLLP